MPYNSSQQSQRGFSPHNGWRKEVSALNWANSAYSKTANHFGGVALGDRCRYGKGSVWGCHQPGLLEVRRILNQQISVFSGEEFNVDAKQDSMTFVISSVAPQNNWRSKHRQSLSWRRRSLTSSLELDSALLRWLRLNASTQPKVNQSLQLMESLLVEHYGGF